MKKIILSLAIASNLLGNINQSYAEVITVKDLKANPSKIWIYNSISLMTSVKDSYKCTIPDTSSDKELKDNITISDNDETVCTISYKYVSYDSLTDFEKKIFDYFQFDKKKFVTIIGFANNNSNLRNGSFTVDSETKILRWILKSYSNNRNITFQLNTCPNANATGTHTSKNTLNNIVFNWNTQ